MSWIYLDKKHKKNIITIAAHTNIDEIVISNYQDADETDIKYVAQTIAHEELHNILAKEIGDEESAGLDFITIPAIQNGWIVHNPRTAFQITNTMKDAIKLARHEIGNNKIKKNPEIDPAFHFAVIKADEEFAEKINIYERKKPRREHCVNMKVGGWVMLDKREPKYSGIDLELDDSELIHLTTKLAEYCLTKRRLKSTFRIWLNTLK